MVARALLELQRFCLDVLFQVIQVFARPWCFPFQHLVKHDAQRPDVALVRKLVSFEDFDGSVQRAAKKSEFLGLIGVVDDATESKIGQFSDALFEEDVGGFDVTVDDIVLEEFFVALNDVFHKKKGLSLTEPGSFFGIKISLKVAVFAIFQEQVQILSTFEIIIEFDDIGRVEFGEVLDFVLDLFGKGRGNFGGIDLFCGYFLFSFHVDAIKHFSCCPLAEFWVND